MMTASPPKAEKKKPQRGYTLLEILVVLAILAALGALVAPRLFNQVDKSKIRIASQQISNLKSALDTMRLDIGRYPNAQEGLAILTTPPNEEAIRASWFGPYLEGDLPKDPWGYEFRYSPPERDENGFVKSPVIYSYGADNTPGGVGMDADIYSPGAAPDTSQ